MNNTLPSPIYAIGDLQGCHASWLQLQSMIDAAHNPAWPPRLWFAGDLVNRGPASLASLRAVRALEPRAQSVLGNHDLHLLAASQGIRPFHKSDTLADILAAPDAADLLDWVRHRPMALFEDGHLLVHAGVLPQWSAQQTLALANEVETVLRGPHWVDFLRDMYGNQPDQWSDNLQGAARLRCIVNGLTRLRFCDQNGMMDFVTKEGAGTNAAPKGYMPWFDVPQRKSQDITVVFGHWSTLGLVQRPNLIALDTGCVWGGKLTAVRLSDRAVFQTTCPQYRTPG